MCRIWKPAFVVMAVVLSVCLLPDSASAGRRNRCGGGCGGGYTNSWNGCSSCAAQTVPVAAPAVAASNSNGNRVQYQSAFQDPTETAPVTVPAPAAVVVPAPAPAGVVYTSEVPHNLPTNQVTRQIRRNVWEYQWRADRKIGGQ